MDFLDAMNGLEKVAPTETGDSAPPGGGSQSAQRMFPTRLHHLSMAACLLAVSALLVAAAYTLNLDLCLKGSSDMEQVVDRYIQPSDRYTGFPQVVVDLMASFIVLVAIFCFYRWASYPKVPPGIQKSIDHVNAEPPEMVQTICKTFFMDLINIELENFFIYFSFMMFFIFLAVTETYLPETIFWPSEQDDFRFLEVPTFCYVGFGLFVYFKPVIIAIIGGFAILCAVSVINLYQDYLHLKRNEKMPVAGITEYIDEQNNAILLNVRFPNLNEVQNQDDGTDQQNKGMESVYVGAVEEIDNCDTRASDMKIV